MVQYIFKCCGRTFNGIIPYREHLKNKHNNSSENKFKKCYECRTCKISYESPLLFIEHSLSERHKNKRRTEEVESKFKIVEKLRKQNSLPCSTIVSNDSGSKCPECSINLTIWTEADKHFRSEKHLKNLIEKELYEVLSAQNVNSERTAESHKPINTEKLSQRLQKIKMEVQKTKNEATSKCSSLKLSNSDDQRNCRDSNVKLSKATKNECSKANKTSSQKTLKEDHKHPKKCQKIEEEKIIVKTTKIITRTCYKNKT